MEDGIYDYKEGLFTRRAVFRLHVVERRYIYEYLLLCYAISIFIFKLLGYSCGERGYSVGWLCRSHSCDRLEKAGAARRAAREQVVHFVKGGRRCDLSSEMPIYLNAKRTLERALALAAAVPRSA